MMTHNEGFENSRLNDGRLTYPVLLEYLDPDVMKMQFQMSSMAHDRRPDHVFHDVSRPVRLGAPAGREHDGRHEPGRGRRR